MLKRKVSARPLHFIQVKKIIDSFFKKIVNKYKFYKILAGIIKLI
ncbi:hypothetical protein SpAn4DRAFT_4147 [Sporomusa ovata]|uniref:Uncharacterized protein n=1 Tax=Sporomusa ovata TaxID=2378 RepID=A0A0U1L556_9FIRM|nr:hypothetical protein SpAn4DRAFT_4147 [Sporomusa ovata]